jgi:hypothetical protein
VYFALLDGRASRVSLSQGAETRLNSSAVDVANRYAVASPM